MTINYITKTFVNIRRSLITIQPECTQVNFAIDYFQPVELSLESGILYCWAYVWNDNIVATHNWFVAWGIRQPNGFWEAAHESPHFF
jgi:hypothetical protein